MSDHSIPLAEQIACVEREVKLRERVYPRWVSRGKMTYVKADREIAVMKSVLQRLREQDVPVLL